MPLAWNSLDGPLSPRLFPGVSFDDLREVFVRGSDGALWHRIEHGAAWADWQSLGTPAHVAGVSDPALALHRDGRLHLFVIGQNGALYVLNKSVGAGTGTWLSLGAPAQGTLPEHRPEILLHDPVVDMTADGRLVVFALASNGPWHIEQHLVDETLSAHSWSGWRPLALPAKALREVPVVGRMQTGSLALLVRMAHGGLVSGVAKDGLMVWSSVELAGAPVNQAVERPVTLRRPDAVPLDLFQRVGSDLVYFVESHDRFVAAMNLGHPPNQAIIGRPAVVLRAGSALGVDILDVFVATESGGLWHRGQRSAAADDWADWEVLGSPPNRAVAHPVGGLFGTTDPTGNPGPQWLDVFVGASDGSLWRITQKAPTDADPSQWPQQFKPVGRPPGRAAVGRPAVARGFAGQPRVLGEPQVFTIKADGAVWHTARTQTGGQQWSHWSRWVSLGTPPGVAIDVTRHIAAAPDAAGHLSVFIWAPNGEFWRRAARDEAGTSWAPWESLGFPTDGTLGGTSGEVALVLDETYGLIAYVLGGDWRIQRRVVGAGTGWEGVCDAPPGPASNPNVTPPWVGLIGSVAVGKNHGGPLFPEQPYFFACWMRSTPDGHWETSVWEFWIDSWQQLGQTLQGSRQGADPVVPSNLVVGENSDGRLELFMNTGWEFQKLKVFHIAQRSPEHPAPWLSGEFPQPTPGVANNALWSSGDPAVGLTSDGRLALVVRTSDHWLSSDLAGTLWISFQSSPALPADQAANWTAGDPSGARWAQLPELTAESTDPHALPIVPAVKWSDPVFGKTRGDLLEVFVRGDDGALYHRSAETAG